MLFELIGLGSCALSRPFLTAVDVEKDIVANPRRYGTTNRERQHPEEFFSKEIQKF